jgi:hypothetical protein
MTKKSVNLIKEYRNYLWKTDKNGKVINQPEGGNDHLLDALRYALETYTYAKDKSSGVVTVTPPDSKQKSFLVNEDGSADAFHINLEEIIKRVTREQREMGDWM